MSSIVLLASINTIAALLICPLSCVSPHSFLKIFNDILLCVYLLFLAKLITHLLFKQAKLYTTLYVWLCIKCVVYIKSFQKWKSPATRAYQPHFQRFSSGFSLFFSAAWHQSRWGRALISPLFYTNSTSGSHIV